MSAKCRGGNCHVTRELEYVDAHGNGASVLVEIEIYVNRGYSGTRWEPREPASADFVSASWRDAKGAWRDVKPGEWLDGWVAAVFEELTEDDLYAALGEAY